MSVERHHIQEENVGAYLLSALTEKEERDFEKHIEECPICQDELERLRPAVDALPRSVEPVTPSGSLKASLMSTVEAEAREARGEARRPGIARRLRERVSGMNAALTGMRPGVAWVAATLVLLAGIAGGAAGLYAVSELTSEEERAQTVAANVDKTRVPNASGSLVVPANARNGAVVRVHGLPALENDSVYQVWLQRKGEVIPESTFTVGQNGEGAAAVADDIEAADAVMITRERYPGAKAPTEDAILSFRL